MYFIQQRSGLKIHTVRPDDGKKTLCGRKIQDSWESIATLDEVNGCKNCARLVSFYRPSPPPAVARLPLNTEGRDFVVGDLHGMVHVLEKALEEVNFDHGADRLIFVGDLVDRGPYSAEALDWLDRPGVFSAKGNHEQLLEDHNPAGMGLGMIVNNGAEWWLRQSARTRDAIRERLAKLPYAIEVETDRGLVGIVHADVPTDMTWQEFTAALENGDATTLNHAIWSRNRIQIGTSGRDIPEVRGIPRVIMGHTPIRRAKAAHNIVYLDTGAAFVDFPWAALTLMQIHPKISFVRIPTYGDELTAEAQTEELERLEATLGGAGI